MAILTLGGEQIEIPLMNFRRIKKAWPHFQKASQVNENEPMASFDDAIEAIRVGLEITVKGEDGRYTHTCPISTEDFNERLLGTEVVGLQVVMTDMMRESGLIRQKKDGSIVGNEPGVEVPENSTETSTASSLNSSPQELKGEVGTE